MLVFRLTNELVVLGGSGVSFLGLHGGEDRYWSLQLIEEFLVLLNSLSNGLIDDLDLVPLLGLNESASLHKPVNDFSVVESKSNLSNFDVLFSWAIHSVVWELVESLFKLKLNVELELLDLSHGVCWIKVVLLEFFIDLLINIKLDSVISSGDCLNVKVDILGLLESLDVIEVDDSEEVNEDSCASSDQSEHLAFVRVVLWQHASSLDVQE